MGGSLTGPNKIKDVYKKIVFYDNNQLKIDNGSADVHITSADVLTDNIAAGTGIETSTSNGTTTISVKDADVLLQNGDINGGAY